MGKRSDFERIGKDFYRTFDPRAVTPLLPHLPPRTRFIEPCAGAGDLIRQLEAFGHRCTAAFDIDPRKEGIVRRDALSDPWPSNVPFATHIITNPPWSRPALHAMIESFSEILPTWLLFDADWQHTKQSAPYWPRVRKVVSVGRVRWIDGSAHDGKDNCAWYLFDRPSPIPAEAYGRVA